MNGTSNKKEIGWINIVRALCMFLVYWNHSEHFSSVYLPIFDKMYGPVFVNAFFCVSGYLLFRKQLSLPVIEEKDYIRNGGGKLLKSIIFKLAIPSLIFSCIVFFPKFYLRGMELDTTQFLIHTVLGRTTWFTCALTVAELLLLFSFFTRIKNLLFYFIYGVLLCIGSYFLFKNDTLILGDPYIPWQYKSAMSAVLFLVAGGIYWKFEGFIDHIFDRWYLVFVIALYTVLAFVIKDNTAVNLGYLTPKAILLDIIGVYVFIRICKLISVNQFFSYWGSHSIGLYFFCGAIPNVIAIIAGRYMDVSLYLTVIIFIISLTVAMTVVYLLNRYTPFLFDVRLLKKHSC